MNWKRLLWQGILFWIVLFVLISIVMFLPFLAGKIVIQNIIVFIIDIVAAFIFATWYFQKAKGGIGNGIIFGIGILLIGIILDMIITVPLYVNSYIEYFSMWTLYLGILLVIITCAIAGAMKKN